MARQDIRLSYDPKSGFFGSKVRGEKFQFTVSEFDRILVVCRDGTYRVVGAVEKMLIPGKIVHCARFDEKKGAPITVIYRDKKKICYAKKCTIERYIREKEYELIKGREGKVDLFFTGHEGCELYLEFVPKKGQRVHDLTVSLDDVPVQGPSARGKRLAAKPVAKVMRLRGS